MLVAASSAACQAGWSHVGPRLSFMAVSIASADLPAAQIMKMCPNFFSYALFQYTSSCTNSAHESATMIVDRRCSAQQYRNLHLEKILTQGAGGRTLLVFAQTREVIFEFPFESADVPNARVRGECLQPRTYRDLACN